MNLSRYSKAIAALGAAIATWWGAITGGPTHISASEWRQGFIALFGVFLVYIVRNDDGTKMLKRDKTARALPEAIDGGAPNMAGRASIALLLAVVLAAAALAACTDPPVRDASPHTALAAHQTKRPLSLDLEFGGTTLPAQLQPNWYGAGNGSVTKPVNGAETACYDPAHVTVHGGFLDLKLTGDRCTIAGHTYPMTTGAVTTLHSFTFTNGTIRARIFVPGDAGGVWNWPALWTDGTGTWPHTGESDIAEGLGGKLCFHVHTDAGGPGGCPAGNYVGWHTFTEKVHAGLTTYLYDGKQVGQEHNANAAQFIIIGNQAGQYGGTVRTPTDVLVDWLRVKATS